MESELPILSFEGFSSQYFLALFSALSVGMGSVQFFVPSFVKRELSARIVQFAFCESIAVMGLLAYLFTAELLLSLLFVSASILLLAFGGRREETL